MLYSNAHQKQLQLVFVEYSESLRLQWRLLDSALVVFKATEEINTFHFVRKKDFLLVAAQSFYFQHPSPSHPRTNWIHNKLQSVRFNSFWWKHSSVNR